MLTADLVVTDSGTATKPGAVGAKTFSLVGPQGEKNLRRIAATATTTPEECIIAHSISGAGFKKRIRSQVRFDIRFNNADTSLTGGVIPSASGYFVLDRPEQSAGIITDAVLQTLAGRVIDVLTVSGQFAKLLNTEA
jgi:hypothetical protein